MSRAATPLLRATSGATATTITTPPTSTTTSAQCVNHTVGTGDFLDSIAANYSVSLPALLAVNPNISEAKALMPGQVIRIPPWPITCTLGNYSTPSTAPAPAPASAPASAPMAAPPAAPPAAPTAAPTAALQTLSIQFSVSGVRGLDAWEGLEGPARAVVLAVQNTNGFPPVTAGVDKALFDSSGLGPRVSQSFAALVGLPPSQVQVA